MKQTFEIQTSLEINFNEISGEIFQALLDLSKETDFDGDYPLELDIEVRGNYWYQKAKLYGEPEDCYPSEFELEVEKVYCNEIEITDLLLDKHFIELQQYCEENTEVLK